MKLIYILEKFNFTDAQHAKLKTLGNVQYFDKANQDQIDQAAKNADIILLDWIDPTNIITKMKPGSFMCLPFTEYGFIATLKQAIQNGVIISNTPDYSTNAVAEHHLGLMLAASKPAKIQGIELKGKTVGIIGLGCIGKRLAELLKSFGVKILTFNRTPKNLPNIKDVSLDELLKQSDFICVTCPLNKDSANMIDKSKFGLIKPNAIITQTTGGVIDLFALEKALNTGKVFAAGLDDTSRQQAAGKMPESLLKNERVICTYHNAFNTKESEHNRLEMCIENIKAYVGGKPINLVKGE